MVKIFSSRGTGRSYQIARYAVENNCNILVAYQNDIRNMKAILDDIFDSDGYVIDEQYKSDECYCYIFRRKFEVERHIIKIYTAYDALRFKNITDLENVVIDDADRVLEYLFRLYKLQALTMDMN